MNALEFISKTKELIPDKKKMSKQNFPKGLIDEYLLNFLSEKSILVEEKDPILWIIKNCNIKSFTIGYIYFIESFVINEFIFFAQLEADYIGINNLSKEIFLIGYEEVDEFLYGDGELPKFENKYLLAINSEHFLDALVEKIRFQKLLKENMILELENREILAIPFKTEAIRLAGGDNYEFGRVF